MFNSLTNVYKKYHLHFILKHFVLSLQVLPVSPRHGLSLFEGISLIVLFPKIFFILASNS